MKGFKGKWSVKLLTQEECEASQQLQMHAQAQHSHGQHSEHAAASHTAANGLHLHAQGAPSVQQVPGQGPVGCVVEHTLSIQPSVPIPPAVAPFTKPIFERQVRPD